MNKKILFVSHKKKKCGVYEFGKNVFNAISRSPNYNFVKIECDSRDDLLGDIKTHDPAAIIYNYHPSVMPWLVTKLGKGVYRNNIAGLHPVQVGIIHEITQQVADMSTGYDNKIIIGRPEKKINSLFNFYIAVYNLYMVVKKQVTHFLFVLSFLAISIAL